MFNSTLYINRSFIAATSFYSHLVPNLAGKRRFQAPKAPITNTHLSLIAPTITGIAAPKIAPTTFTKPAKKKSEQSIESWFLQEGYAAKQPPTRSLATELFLKSVPTSQRAFTSGRTTVAGGAGGGAYFTLNEKEEKIGVFKIDEKHRGLILGLSQVKKEFIGQRSYLQFFQVESKAEAASSILERSVKYGLGDTKFYTPQVALRTFGKISGGLQEFMPGVEDKTAWLSKNSYTEKEYETFQEFALLDFALGNLDRHEENWLINTDEKGELVNIRAIDNANTFPQVTYSSKKHFLPIPKKQYLWGEETIAKAPCRESVRARAKEMFSPMAYKQAIRDIESNVPGFLNKEMKARLKERFEALTILIEKPDFKPSDLRLYRDDVELQKLLAMHATKS